MTSPLIKICGITRIDDARAAVDLGADFIGLIFVGESPRRVDLDGAARIAEAVRKRSGTAGIVGVFRDAPAAAIHLAVSYAGLDLVQLHGDETDDLIRELVVPAIKALRVGAAVPDASPFPNAAWILYDSFSPRVAGGSGEVFDWSLPLHGATQRRFFLAGGLTPENVREAIDRVSPDAIDLSSGVESAPGIKDLTRLERLFKAAR